LQEEPIWQKDIFYFYGFFLVSCPVQELDAARALTRLMPEVPVIMYSAYGDSFTREKPVPQAYRH